MVRFDGHPNIIRCRDYFEANGTAYLVMDFEDGLPLDTFLARREAQGQPLTEAELRHLLHPGRAIFVSSLFLRCSALFKNQAGATQWRTAGVCTRTVESTTSGCLKN